MQPSPRNLSEDSLIIHCGTPVAVGSREVSVEAAPAIHVSSSYLFRRAEGILDVTRGAEGYVYRRYGNENTTDLSNAVAQLEGGKYGACQSCGMGAISSAFIAAGVLDGNKSILGPYCCYGSTFTLIKSRFAHIANCQFADMSDTEATIAHIKQMKPDILYMETCSNPLTVIPDLSRLAAEAKAANPKAISIVDNTYATPLLVKPLSLGVDVVVHSMTKYINGHGDVLAGCIVSNREEYMQAVQHAIVDFGATLSPWDAWLALRGLRTLGVRMDKIGRNAFQVASFLSNNPRVSRVYYPGFVSHPQHALAKKILAKRLTAEEEAHGFPFSGMISFDINVTAHSDDEKEKLGTKAVKTFLDTLKLVSNQVSLGDVKSLASAPGLSTQQQVPVEDRLRSGINASTIRLSVGMESVEELCNDIEQALVQSVPQCEAKKQNSPDLTPDPDVSCLSISEPIALSTQQKTARLRELYDQMDAITAECEALQNSIRSDQVKLRRSLDVPS